MSRIKVGSMLVLFVLLATALFTAGTTAVSAAPAAAEGSVLVTFGDLVYGLNSRIAFVDVTVQNVSVAPGVASGHDYFKRQQDGNEHPVTLLGVAHTLFPVPLPEDPEYGLAPLWRARVAFTDGQVTDYYVGCNYLETVEADGFEPPDMHWRVDWPGGWFDCGNSYRVIPDDDLSPGVSATVPLTIYTQHPREWSAPPPTRRISNITLSVWASDGTLLDKVGTQSFSN